MLYEAAREAVEDRAQQARERAGRRSRPRTRFPWSVVLLGIALAGATLLAVRPGWLAGPRSMPAESPGVAAASLRVVLVRERGAILDFIRRTGRTPATLAEVGSPASNLEYRRETYGFSLTGRAGDSLITIRSTDSTAVFLGDSFTRLRRRGAS